MIPILTNFIVAEIYTLILIRVGADKARAWIKNNIWHIERITEEDEKRAINILLSYTDKTFSYTDATTFALMERLNIDTALLLINILYNTDLNNFNEKKELLPLE